MSVYITMPLLRRGRFRISHLIADSLDELHMFAKSIGLKPVHFQPDARIPHYNLVRPQAAVEAGAKLLKSRAAVLAVFKRLREGR